MHYFVGHVFCLGILGVILRKKNKLGSLWFLPRIKECGVRPNASTWQVRTT